MKAACFCLCLAAVCRAATEAPLPTTASAAFAPLDIVGPTPPVGPYLAELAILTNRAPALQVRNWYADLFAPSNPPPADMRPAAVAEALVLPEGIYATLRDASEIVAAEPETCQALVARYRDGLARTNIAVRIEHAGESVGRVTRLRYDRGVGVWATVELDATVEPSSWSAVSPELRVLSHVAADSVGAWGRIVVPWAVTGLALTADPALPGTRLAVTDVRTPPYDAEIAFLETTGMQWVDTLTPVSPRTRIVAKWTQTGFDTQQRLFGVNDGSGKVFALYINYNRKWAVNTGTSSGGPMISVVPDTIYEGSFDLASGECTINGTTTQNGGTPFSSTNSIPIFTRRNVGVAMMDYPAQMRLHLFRIYDGDIVVRDFVPVRRGAVGFLYDRVSGQTFGNSGDGDFAIGTDQ